jgi:hypothetical protein
MTLPPELRERAVQFALQCFRQGQHFAAVRAAVMSHPPLGEALAAEAGDRELLDSWLDAIVCVAAARFDGGDGRPPGAPALAGRICRGVPGGRR